ncbi:MAG: lipopolysaccharide heptosyltransferase II [Ignavibacteriae bacterium]|nr:lipopolysaccharide heptosyltransferase II [Ignavibacteriota bacterium]NOG97880.1 lipopolysaccharide heptosyltransferase II [Ignavibacteriota bacterium]
MKILLIALSGIGDALMFTPALQKLKEHYPDSNIDALVMFNGVKDIYERLPEINNIHHFDFLNSSPIAALKYIISLRKKYDVSINVYPSNRKEYNIISFLIGADKRAAVKYLRSGFSNLSFLNNILFVENDELHNVEENIKLVEKLTGNEIKEIPPYSFPLTGEDENIAAAFLSDLGINEDEKIIGFHAGCSTLKNHIHRRWAPANFAELAKKLIDKNYKVLIFGGPEEAELKTEISNKVNSENFIKVDTKSLAHSAAVMQHCQAFVTNDSSLMHVASALQLNVAAIIGPTNTNYIRPWKTNHKVVSLNLDCSPCFFYSPKPLTCSRTDVKFKCVKEISVEMVLNTVEELLKK